MIDNPADKLGRHQGNRREQQHCAISTCRCDPIGPQVAKTAPENRPVVDRADFDRSDGGGAGHGLRSVRHLGDRFVESG